jgi:hypothetical protein
MGPLMHRARIQNLFAIAMWAVMAAYLFALVALGSEPLTIEQRIERLENAVFPTPWMKAGPQFTLNGEPFRDVTVTLAGDACNQSDAQLNQMFDRIQACGCKLVRVLHVAIDDRLPPSQYQPNLGEWRAGFKILDRLVAQCKKRGMLLWITLHHRQRLSLAEAQVLGVDDTLFAPQPVAGEIGFMFLVMPQLEKFVGDYCVELASRFKDEPTVALMTIANEKVRYTGYFPSADRKRTDATRKTYRDAWFSRLDEYQAAFGVTDSTMHANDFARFHAWNACKVYRRMYQRLRDSGVKCPIASSCGLGDCNMSVLPILAAGDFIDWHSYGFVTDKLPNPFTATEGRSISAIARAVRLPSHPLVMGEHADVHEGKKLMLPGYLNGPSVVAKAGFDVSCHYCAFLGPIGFGKEYGGFDVPNFEAALKSARDEFMSATLNDRTYHQLTESDLFGSWQKIDGVWKDVPPPIVGTVDYGADGVELPAEVLKWGRP